MKEMFKMTLNETAFRARVWPIVVILLNIGILLQFQNRTSIFNLQ